MLAASNNATTAKSIRMRCGTRNSSERKNEAEKIPRPKPTDKNTRNRYPVTIGVLRRQPRQTSKNPDARERIAGSASAILLVVLGLAVFLDQGLGGEQQHSVAEILHQSQIA